jgi:hypothetical protein
MPAERDTVTFDYGALVTTPAGLSPPCHRSGGDFVSQSRNFSLRMRLAH